MTVKQLNVWGGPDEDMEYVQIEDKDLWMLEDADGDVNPPIESIEAVKGWGEFAALHQKAGVQTTIDQAPVATRIPDHRVRKGQVMQLFVNITPLKAGTGEPVGKVEKIWCPGDVEADTLLSYLSQRLGEPIDVAWTSSARHPRLELGWIFPSTAYGRAATLPSPNTELLVVPFTYDSDGSVIPFFELQANEMEVFEKLAQGGAFDAVSRFSLPHRQYRPDEKATGGGGAPGWYGVTVGPAPSQNIVAVWAYRFG